VRNLGLCVICTLLIENRFGRCVIVQNEMNRTLAFLRRERLKREDVDVLIGESLAQLSKRSRRRILPARGVGAARASKQAHRLSVDDKSDCRTSVLASCWVIPLDCITMSALCPG
jgi:hypothetical protein